MNSDFFELPKRIDTLDSNVQAIALKPDCSGLEPQSAYAHAGFVDTTIDSILMNRFSSYFSPQLTNFNIRILSLEEQLKNFREKQPKQIYLNNLRCSHIILKQPLFVIFEKNESEITCGCPDVDLYGVGETEQEAIIDFSESLEDLFFSLKEEGEDNLGPQMLYIWRFLKKIISETNAVKSKAS